MIKKIREFIYDNEHLIALICGTIIGICINVIAFNFWIA